MDLEVSTLNIIPGYMIFTDTGYEELWNGGL